MPSIVVHVAVAKKVANKLDISGRDYFVGAISPDLSKLLGNPREYSHFCDSRFELPNIDRFLYKYKDYLNNLFVLGYFVHLYTDYLYESYFVSRFLNEKRDIVTKIDGTKVNCNEAVLKQYMYNDYTDLNEKLISKYKLDFSFLDEEYKTNSNIIEEIPIDKIDILFKTTKDIIDRSTVRKNFLFNLKDIISFVDFSSQLISQKILSMNILDK